MSLPGCQQAASRLQHAWQQERFWLVCQSSPRGGVVRTALGPSPPPHTHTHTVELCLVMWLLCRRWRLALQVGLLRLAFWVAAVVQDVTALVLPPLAA